jgi:hypothetical protein
LTPDVCKDHTCTNECQENCCWISEDCDDGNECTCDHCEFGKCYHSTDWNLDPFCVPPPDGCCTGVDDCDDSNPCSLDFCVAGSCVHKPAPFAAGCCESVADCPSPTFWPGEVVACSQFNCVHQSAGPWCEEGDNGVCDDGAPCTTDLCVAGECQHLLEGQSPGTCCKSDLQCDDSNPCTADHCAASAEKHPALDLVVAPGECVHLPDDCAACGTDGGGVFVCHQGDCFPL